MDKTGRYYDMKEIDSTRYLGRVVMNHEELVKRFFRLEGTDIVDRPSTNNLYLSRDTYLGILASPTPQELSKFRSFGRMKLNRSLKSMCNIKISDRMYLDIALFHRAMMIFRRRRKFELGLFPLNVENSREVLAIREGDLLVLIAPRIPTDEDSRKREEENSVPLAKLVVRMNKSLFEGCMMWLRILENEKV